MFGFHQRSFILCLLLASAARLLAAPSAEERALADAQKSFHDFQILLRGVVDRGIDAVLESVIANPEKDGE